jgi:hypothetical protein
MKIRILILSVIGLMFFNSCSSDSNSSNPTSQNLDPNTILPKKVIIERPNSKSITYDFFYNQNKIDHIDVSYIINNVLGSSFPINFTYTGNLITKIEWNSGVMNYNYQNNKLVNKQISENYQGVNTSNNFDYVYNQNGTISASKDGTSYATYTLNTDNLIVNTGQYDVWYNSTSSPFTNILGVKECFINYFFNNPDTDATGPTPSIYNNGPVDDLFFSTIKNINTCVPMSGAGYKRIRYNYIYNDIQFPSTIFKYVDYLGSTNSPSTSINIFYQ